MVILIGGSSHTGKTYMAQRLLEIYKYPYLSIDHLKMGLYRANIDCGFNPCDDCEIIGEKLWDILKGIIMTNIENKQNLIIEGWYLFPQYINQLKNEYQKHIISFYLGFSKAYIVKHFQSEVLFYRNIIEARDENTFTIDDFILQNMQQKEQCQKHYAKYFEIDENYQRETDVIYEWIDSLLSVAKNI